MDDIKYAHGKIYKLINKLDNEMYVGSTCLELKNRLCCHKCFAKTHQSQLVYKHLNAIGWQNVDIVLIEEYPCFNKTELEIREKYWIFQLKPSLNTRLTSSCVEQQVKQQEVAKLLTQLMITYSMNLPNMIKGHFKTETS